ncbi:ATP-binding protein [Streptomyces sp. SID4926]|nr:ATP-binding protein [Streptomyces sp. SID4926]SCE60282.1 Anti-sigma regulatory factor (Ser/Thr protein kinase) [Streptomyces sp. DfronAA-171]
MLPHLPHARPGFFMAAPAVLGELTTSLSHRLCADRYRCGDIAAAVGTAETGPHTLSTTAERTDDGPPVETFTDRNGDVGIVAERFSPFVRVPSSRSAALPTATGAQAEHGPSRGTAEPPDAARRPAGFRREPPPPIAAVGPASDFVSGRTLGHGIEVAFASDKARVAEMRRITRDQLRCWRTSEALAGDIVLAVSELVTNAVCYGSGYVSLRVWPTTGELVVEVRDGAPQARAEIRRPGDEEASGRGIFLVATLADRWGVSDGGATTWCLFSRRSG